MLRLLRGVVLNPRPKLLRVVASLAGRTPEAARDSRARERLSEAEPMDLELEVEDDGALVLVDLEELGVELMREMGAFVGALC